MNTTGSQRVLAAVGLASVVLATVAFPAAAARVSSSPSAHPSSGSGPTEPNGSALVAACYDQADDAPVFGHGTCRGIEQLDRDLAQLCRFPRSTVPTPEEACSAVDGRVYSEAAMAEYEASWVHRALSLQAHIDDGVPLRDALIPATHNSFNAATQPPTLSGLDHNQVASLTDQLRMDMRSVELDLHWSPSASGAPENGLRAPVVCHAEPIDISITTIHAGCTTERPLEDALAEVETWLDDNPDAFLLLYLENALDDDVVAHNTAAAAIQATIGDLVFQPATNCGVMPTAMSKADVLAAEKRVLIVGNCGPGAWGSWVHDRGVGPVWDEDKSEDGDDFICPPSGYGNLFKRYYEDSTWLSDTAEPSGLGSSGAITAAETRAMVGCGVNLFGFDQLLPSDPRLEALIWSWAPNHPATGTAALRSADGRFRSANPADTHGFACRNAAGSWYVTSASGPQAGGDATCAAEAPGYSFDLPETAIENAALTTTGDVWIDYAISGTTWTPHP